MTSPDDLWCDEDGLVRRTVTDGPDLLADLRNGTWLDRQEFPPLRWAVDGVIPEGYSLFAGAPKVGKSWLTLAVGLAVAAGGRALGRIRVQRRPVLLLALEDGDRRLQSRARTLLGDDEPIPAKLNYLTRITPGTVVATITAWLEIHGDSAPLVVLDTLGKVKPPAAQGESAYQHDYRVGSTLKRACDDWPGTSLVVVHHLRKATTDDFVDSISGTHGLAGAADSIITLTRARHEGEGLLKVTGRDVIEREYALRFADGAWTLDGATLDDAAATAAQNRASEGLSDRSAEIVALVSGSETGLGPSDVAAKLSIEVKAAGTYLGRLVDSGRLRKVGRGRYVAANSTTPHSPHTPQGPSGGPARPRHLHPVESVDSVDSAGESVADPAESVDIEDCARCRRGPAIPGDPLGLCRGCAYPTEPDEQETP